MREDATVEEALAEMLRPPAVWTTSAAGDASVWWRGADGRCCLVVERPTEPGWILKLWNLDSGDFQYRVGAPKSRGRVEVESGGDSVSFAGRYLCDEAVVEEVLRDVFELGWTHDDSEWDRDVDLYFVYEPR